MTPAIIEHWELIVRRADEALVEAARAEYVPHDISRLARVEFYDACYDICGMTADQDRRLLDACADHYARRVRYALSTRS